MDRGLFELSAYLDRLGLERPIPADSAGLARVQRAHRQAIPFENLDILLGRGIDLAPEAVFDKLVRRRRGGYCFEQNRLFLDALKAMGFAARRLMARVWYHGPVEVPGRTHVLLLVTLSGRPWIADAGFGGGYAPPMPLIADRIVADGGTRHRLRQHEEHGWLAERDGGEGWIRQMSFTLDEVHESDIAIANHWTATAPASRFTTSAVLGRILPDGDVSLIDRRLTRRQAGGGAKRDIADAASYRATLADLFGIALGEEEVATLPMFR
jgi:N-hydroxyarylamine O-acetyltransferase